MEAAVTTPEVKSQELSIGKKETKAPSEVALPVTKEEVRASEKKDESKFKAPECSGTSDMEAKKDPQSERTARAAEKVAKAQVAMVLKTAKAELKHRRTASLKNPDPHVLKKRGMDESEKK